MLDRAELTSEQVRIEAKFKATRDDRGAIRTRIATERIDRTNVFVLFAAYLVAERKWRADAIDLLTIMNVSEDVIKGFKSEQESFEGILSLVKTGDFRDARSLLVKEKNKNEADAKGFARMIRLVPDHGEPLDIQ